MLYVHACLSRSRLCHDLCLPWAYSCVVTFIPLVAYWGVTTCETHPRDASLLDAYPISTPCDVACHSCFVPPVWLSLLLCILFAHLPTCLYTSLCFLLSSILESNGTMDTQSKPTFVLLGYPLLFYNKLACPHLASFASLSLSMLSFYFVSLLVCWLVSFVIACTCA